METRGEQVSEQVDTNRMGKRSDFDQQSAALMAQYCGAVANHRWKQANGLLVDWIGLILRDMCNL